MFCGSESGWFELCLPRMYVASASSRIKELCGLLVRVEGPPSEFGFVLHEALVSGSNSRLEHRLELIDEEAISEKATQEDSKKRDLPEPGFS